MLVVEIPFLIVFVYLFILVNAFSSETQVISLFEF